MVIDSIGSGNKLQNANFALTENIEYTVMSVRVKILTAYIIAGPRYIRTLDTSSTIRAIISPVLFSLKK